MMTDSNGNDCVCYAVLLTERLDVVGVRVTDVDNGVGYLVGIDSPEEVLDTDRPALCWFGPGEDRTFEEALEAAREAAVAA